MMSKIKSWLHRFRTLFFCSSPLCLLSHYEDSASTMIVVKDKLGQVFKKKLTDIARNQALIQQFSAKDAHLLGYLLGHEDTLASMACEKSLTH